MEPSRVRVASDQRGERTPFEAIEVGTLLGPLEWTVTPEAIERQCRIDEDYHEWYSVDSPFGGRIAPLLISYAPGPLHLLGQVQRPRASSGSSVSTSTRSG